eukprot:16451735-Heterocapsa_arctica.AAC.1
MSYASTHSEEVLVGSLSTSDLLTAQLVASPDADLAGDKTTTKSTSGLWLELRSLDGQRCWPLSWHSRKQGSTASHTCEAELISLATALKKDAYPMLTFLEAALSRKVDLVFLEDNEQTIGAVRNGYSAALRHVSRTERISLGVMNEALCSDSFTIRHEPTKTHKGDLFTKILDRARLESAKRMVGMVPAASTD